MSEGGFASSFMAGFGKALGQAVGTIVVVLVTLFIGWEIYVRLVASYCANPAGANFVSSILHMILCG